MTEIIHGDSAVEERAAAKKLRVKKKIKKEAVKSSNQQTLI